ncbi:MAG TPA: GTP-binding protein [Euryarchaeota archaeon]|nr:GTP-binding protein [Euryarchaeota archaeon]
MPEDTVAMNDQDIRKIKICLVGDIGVGKTSLIRRYVLDLFDDKYIATIGTKVSKKNLSVDNPETGNREDIVLLIWDIMGQPSFREILREAYFYGAQGALCVCDITNRDTFAELRYWIKAMTATAGPVPMVVLGNKKDLEQNAAVSIEDLAAFSNKFDSRAIMTSAKTGENVEEAFSEIITRVLSAISKHELQ